MAGKIIEIHDPVSKDSIELTDKENKQYQGILNIALDLEEKHKKAREEIQEEYRKFLKRNEQHYKKYKELEAELKEGKITTKDFNSIDNLAYNTIQSEFIQSKDKLAVAETANNSEVEKHQKTLEEFQATVVTRHRLEKAKSEYNRIKEDIDRCKLIVATLKQQIKKPPHHITELSLAHLQRDLKKYQYHLSLLEKRRVRRYRVYRKERPPVEEVSDTEYSDGGYSSAEDLKGKECLPHRYKLTRSGKRIPHPPQPTPQPDIEPHPIEVDIDPINPVEPVDTIPIVEPVEQERINMEQQRLEEIVREIMRRGEYNPENAGNARGHGNGHRQDRNDRDDRSLRYSMRDIPTYDGKGDAMPHTHLIEFEDFLVNTGSEINDLPQFDEPQPVDAAHYQGVIKDVVSKFKASLKGKPRLWFEMQYPTVNDEPKTVQGYRQMLSAFTTEHNPIGSTREQQIMAWKNLKWDPSKEKLDDFVYRFRRVAKELGYNADDNLEVFSCCVPSHLYLYLKGATSIKEAMENIKRACALGGVSAQGPPMIETQTAPVVPFMQMNDRPSLRTVSFKNEVAHIAPDKNDIMIDMLAKISEKLDTSDSKSRSRNRERRDSRDRGSRYDRSTSYDRSSSCDRSQSRERSNSRDRGRDRGRDRSRDRNGRYKGRNQSSRERRNNSGTSSGLYCEHCKMTNHDITHCFKLQKTLKKKGIEWSEMNKKVKDDQELYQKFMKFLEIESTN